MTQLQAGDMAPDFKSTTQDGAALTLADLKGQRTILYFYPKDNTSGCTLEAKSLRDGRAELARMGFRIIGVSPDSEKIAPELLCQARPEFHAARRHRPQRLRSLRGLGRKVDVRPQIYGRTAHDVRHRRRGADRKGIHQGRHRKSLPANPGRLQIGRHQPTTGMKFFAGILLAAGSLLGTLQLPAQGRPAALGHELAQSPARESAAEPGRKQPAEFAAGSPGVPATELPAEFSAKAHAAASSLRMLPPRSSGSGGCRKR